MERRGFAARGIARRRPARVVSLPAGTQALAHLLLSAGHGQVLMCVSTVALHQRLGQLTQRVAPGAEGVDDQPLLGPRAKARQHAGANEGRLAAARSAEHHDEARRAALDQFDARQRLVLTAEEHRRMLFLIGAKAQVGRLAGIPVARCAQKLQRLQGSPQPGESLFRTSAQIDELPLAEDGGHHGLGGKGVALQGDDMLAFHARQRDLGEAPVGAQIVIGAQCDHRAAGAQLAIERALPALAGDDALFRIQIEEDRMMLAFREPALDGLRQLVVVRAVADEERAHRPREP